MLLKCSPGGSINEQPAAVSVNFVKLLFDIIPENLVNGWSFLLIISVEIMLLLLILQYLLFGIG